MKRKKKIQIFIGISSGIAIGLIAPNLLNNLSPNTAQAFDIPSSQITYVPSITTNNNIEVDATGDPAKMSWGKAGTTQVQIIKGSVIGKSTDYNLGAPNTPRTPVDVYSNNVGDKYRITNIGTTESGKKLDLIATIISNSPWTPPAGQVSGTPALIIAASSNLGPQADPFNSIAFFDLFHSQSKINFQIVQAGTNTPVTVTTATYWSDIDVYQGVNENLTNQKMLMSNSAATKANLALDGQWVYSTSQGTDFDGLNNANESAYIGVGTKNNFDVHYKNVYDKYQSNVPGQGSGYRFDLFGQYNNIIVNPPNKVTEPKKTISDSDEKNVQTNNTGLATRDFEYDVSVKTGKGKFKQLVMTDTFPKEFKTSKDKIKVYAGSTDVTDKFDISLSGQNLKVSLKTSENNAAELQSTTVRVNAKGTGPEWLGGKFTNTANWNDGFTSQDTNPVETTIPDKPEVKKTVSTTGEFKPAETPETAESVTNRPDDYIWKLDFTLSNYTNFTKIELKDNMESLQTVDLSKVKVYDWDGKDVTSQGKVTSTPSGDKNVITWSANTDLINTVNAKYGKNSKEKPTFAMRVTTNVKDATNQDEAKYYNKDLGVVVIPNVGTVTEGDNTGDVSVDSNTSHVKFPKPGESSVSKLVAKDGTDPLKDEGWAPTLSLDTHDELYSYKTIFNLSKNFNYNNNGLTLKDKFENLQSYKEVKLYSDNVDVTSEFNISSSKVDKVTTISAIPKDLKKWSDTGKTVIMYILGANLSNATEEQEREYVEPLVKIPGDPYNRGITIPNTSELEEKSSIEKWSKTQDSKTTTVNYWKPPIVKKSVATTGEFKPATTPETAESVKNRPDEYTWKVDFELSNYTNFTNIQLQDTFENLQALDIHDVQVLDWDGKDVTKKGMTSVIDVGNNKKLIDWQASDTYIKEVNSKYGIGKRATPKFTVLLKTNVKDATSEQEGDYYNPELKQVVIPNVANLIQGDHVPKNVEMPSNKSHIKLPKPGMSTISKQVAKSGTDYLKENGWSNSLKLSDHNQKYDYRTKFHLSKDFNYNSKGGLLFIDRFENLQYYDEVKMIDIDSKVDITKSFDFEFKKGKYQTQIIAKPKNLKEWSDTARNVQMVVLGATITDSSEEQESHYIEPNPINIGKDNPFDRGITVPNRSNLSEYSGVPGYSKEQESNHTYINYWLKPTVTKTVKTDSDFVSANTPKESENVKNRPDNYIWKLDFKLSNYTKFENIDLVDNLEFLQNVNTDNIQVLDWDGKDVTSQGDFVISRKDNINKLKWSPNKNYLSEINTEFGKTKRKQVEFTMLITTNIKDAKATDEAKYYNEDLGKVVIPNIGNLTFIDHAGDVSEDSNKSHVNFPKPGESNIKKEVAKDGTDPLHSDGWSDKLELDTHSTLYSYKTKFDLSKNFNYNSEGGLILTDKFENLQAYKSVKILTKDGKDVTNQFVISAKDKDSVKTITATLNNSSSFNDKGDTLLMVIDGVTLDGATGEQEANYIDFKDSDTGFNSGVTIPNISNIKELSPVPGYSKEKDSNKTFTNFAVDPSIEKWVEDDQSAVIDPGEATDELSVSDAIGDAQSTIDGLSDAKMGSDDVQQLRKALLTSSDAKEIKRLSDKLK